MALRNRDFGRSYTAQEFEKMPEFNERYELINGKLIEKPMPKVEHGLIADIIRIALHEHDRAKNLGVMLAEISVSIREDYTPAPDLSFWMADRKPARKVLIAARPDLAIEIQSRDQRLTELRDKALEYLKAGVKLVWIIQPNKKIAAVFHLGQTKPITIQPTGELDGEDVIPGFKLKLSELFE